MSFLLRLTRTLRPAPFTASPLRAQTNAAKSLSPNYFSPHDPHCIGLRKRFYSSYNNYQNNYAQNLKVIYGLIGLNVGIFGYNAYLQAKAKQGFHEPAVKFIRNMSVNYEDVFREGKWWTLVTACFMHNGVMHLVFNMVSAYAFGPIVASIPGVTPFRLLALVFGSGITGAAGYLFQRARVLNEEKIKHGHRVLDNTRGMGFSGAVMGLGMVAAIARPSAKMLIYGIVPAPMWALMLGYLVWDGYYVNDPNSRVAHAGHLGGSLFGAFYAVLRLRVLRM